MSAYREPLFPFRENDPHVFVKKRGQRQGEDGWDGDPDSCAACHCMPDKPKHRSGLTELRAMAEADELVDPAAIHSACDAIQNSLAYWLTRLKKAETAEYVARVRNAARPVGTA